MNITKLEDITGSMSGVDKHSLSSASPNDISNNSIPPTAQNVNTGNPTTASAVPLPLTREAGTNTDALYRAAALGRNLGRTVHVAKLPAGHNGMFKDGVIYLSKNSPAPALTTLAHELTHSIAAMLNRLRLIYSDSVIPEINENIRVK